jgi:cell division protein FtsW (lipid II flippase)/serine/threonine protein phosphatase PrpC
VTLQLVGAVARSDIGHVREGNEDSAYAGSHLLAVADGMGGHAAGEVASSVTITALARLDDDVPGADLLGALRGAVEEANAMIRDMVAADPHLSGMGTTLTAILTSGQRVGLVHIGDSRAYLLRDNALSQITHDHTYVQDLVDAGQITAEEASHHPRRSLLLRALDGRPETEMDLRVREARAGDRYLLCSDGLSSVVTDTTIGDCLRRPTPEESAQALIDLALRAGGPDNITVVVADVTDSTTDGAAAPPPVPQVAGAAALDQQSGRGVARLTAAGRAALIRPRRAGAPAPAAPGPPTARPRAARGDRGAGGRGHRHADLARPPVVRQRRSRHRRDRAGRARIGGRVASAPCRRAGADRREDAAAQPVDRGLGAGRLAGQPDGDQPGRGPGRSPAPRAPGQQRPHRAAHAGPYPHADHHCRGLHATIRARYGRSVTTPVPVAGARGRGTELLLSLFAVLVGTGAQAAVSIDRTNSLDPQIFTYGLTLLALAVTGHVAVRLFAPFADPLLLPLAILLVGLGFAIIVRIDDSVVGTSYAPLQVVWCAIGMAGFVAILAIVRDHRTLARYGYTCALVGLGLLLLPAILPARFSEVNGSRVWIRFSGFSLQPSEISKILLIVFFAAYLMSKRDVMSLVNRSFLGLKLPRGRDLGPVLVAWLASVGLLVRENDLGMSILFFGVFIAVIYVATERSSWVVLGLVLVTAGAFLADKFEPHVRERFNIWLDAFNPAYVRDQSYQLVQALYGFAGGGIGGTGLGRGHPYLVPYARSDFIFASLGEELGLVGVFAVLAVYGIVVQRGLRAAVGVRDPFGKLLASGLAVSLALQVFVVVGGVMRLIPLTGLTTPFLSYGGSSVVANFALVALLLRVSDAARRPVPAMREAPYSDAPTGLIRSAEAPTEAIGRIPPGEPPTTERPTTRVPGTKT